MSATQNKDCCICGGHPAVGWFADRDLVEPSNLCENCWTNSNARSGGGFIFAHSKEEVDTWFIEGLL